MHAYGTQLESACGETETERRIRETCSWSSGSALIKAAEVNVNVQFISDKSVYMGDANYLPPHSSLFLKLLHSTLRFVVPVKLCK